MKTLAIAIAFFSLVPALGAQQAETTDNTPQASPQTVPLPASQDPQGRQETPAAIRPGHALDPADVDILTGKRDREIEAARRASVQVMVGAYGEYGTYGDYFWMNGRHGGEWDMPMLPLAQISNPFFFGFGRGGFGGGGFGRGGSRRGR